MEPREPQWTGALVALLGVMDCKVRFWGVRGSVPTPGPATAKVGGNTSCVEITHGDDRIILDAGTGIRELGATLQGAVNTSLLLSHLHWDHIQGFPFFAPVFRKDTKLTIYGNSESGSIRDALHSQMAPPTFPVPMDQLPSQIEYKQVSTGSTQMIGGFRVTAARLNHPNSVLAYRIECDHCSVVYATDTEHYEDRIDETLVQLAANADMLIYDSMYTEDEYAGKGSMSRKGWGHSTWAEGVKIAKAANVGRLVLFHHDPGRTDEQVEALEYEASKALPGTIAARENTVLRVDCDQKRKAA